MDFDLKAARIHPLPRLPDNKVRAGKPFLFPDEGHRKAGARLVAELPPGSETSLETLRVFALRRDPGSLLDGADTYEEIANRLMRSGIEWTEDVRMFSVHRR